MIIEYKQKILSNGLNVLVHTDKNTPIVALNLLYNVGAKNEDPEKTGFAHLFEHLMFGGSKNAPDYDRILDEVGGENNAFTNNDFTNYYVSIPKPNLETALWLESDRMQSLIFSEKSLKVQKGVVIEEYKQRYLNQPYGDVSLLLRPLCYQVHPYAWSTIGKDISHIEKACLDDVKAFYEEYYCPDNAILVLAGDVEAEEMFALCEKYFGHIPAAHKKRKAIALEPEQTQARQLKVERSVPHNSIYKAYHMSSRMHPDFYAFDLISDILSNGKSSRFYVDLVKKQRLFNDLNAYVSGDIDAGCFSITGNLASGVTMEQAEAAIEAALETLRTQDVAEEELKKVKNKVEASLVFSNVKVLDRAMNLAYFELLGGADLVNNEVEEYKKVSASQIKACAEKYLKESNCSTLYYYADSTESFENVENIEEDDDE